MPCCLTSGRFSCLQSGAVMKCTTSYGSVSSWWPGFRFKLIICWSPHFHGAWRESNAGPLGYWHFALYLLFSQLSMFYLLSKANSFVVFFVLTSAWPGRLDSQPGSTFSKLIKNKKEEKALPSFFLELFFCPNIFENPYSF